MDGKTDTLASARVRNVRRISTRDQPTRGHKVSQIFSLFEADEVDEAMQIFRSMSSQEDKDHATRTVVDSRNNQSITRFLTEIQRESGDQVDSTIKKYDWMTFESAVLFATLNDDPETLKAILDWGEINFRKRTVQEVEDCEDSTTLGPIMIASLENYSGCLPLLFKAGYRIKLPVEDEANVTNMLILDQHTVSSAQFYYTVNKERDSYRFRKMQKERLDPVEHYLKFRGHANPLYLSVAFTSQEEELLSGDVKLEEELLSGDVKLEQLDPIRKAFVLSHYTKHLKGCFPEHAVQYKEIRRSCQDFAKNVLEHCNSIKEVCTLLEYCPEGLRHRRGENMNWQLAIWEEHKGFVSHPYFQHYIWSKMIGTRLDWDSYFLICKFLMFPFAVLIFFAYPFIVIFDSIFLDGNILFVSPEELKARKSGEKIRRDAGIEGEEGRDETRKDNTETSGDQNPSDFDYKENVLMDFFRVRIHRPVYRMFITGFFEAVFLFSLFFSIRDPNDEPRMMDLSWYDIVTWYFILNYLIEDLINIARWNWNFFTSIWNIYSLINHLILVIGGIIAWRGFSDEMETSGDDNRTHFGGNHAINVGMTLVSYGASMSFFRSVHWLLLHCRIGPVLLCIIRVMKDVLYICFIAGIAYFAFAVGAWSMYKPFQKAQEVGYNNTLYTIDEKRLTESSGWRALFSLMFWSVFNGDYSNTQVMRSDPNEGEGKSYSMEFSHVMGITMFALYQGLTVILLINILIALMNSTYNKVWENADMEWKYSKAYYQIQFHHPRAVFPPPFCSIYYFAKFMWWIRKKKDSKTPQKNKEYLNLLLKLVKNKMHIDVETSTQDDFDDLRKDIKNMVNSKGNGACEGCEEKEREISHLKQQIAKR